jgi:serine/threonine-protein kinase RsbW
MLIIQKGQMEKHIRLTSKIENLREVERIIDDISAEIGFGTEVYGNILIACIEAVNNAISHGNKLDPGKDVEVNFKNEGNKLIVTTKDQGKGFDYENVPDPTAPENIENINGRGIFLMKHLSDGLTFREDGRVSEMIFYI